MIEKLVYLHLADLALWSGALRILHKRQELQEMRLIHKIQMRQHPVVSELVLAESCLRKFQMSDSAVWHQGRAERIGWGLGILSVYLVHVKDADPSALWTWL